MIGQTERDYKGVEAQFMKKKILVLLGQIACVPFRPERKDAKSADQMVGALYGESRIAALSLRCRASTRCERPIFRAAASAYRFMPIIVSSMVSTVVMPLELAWKPRWVVIIWTNSRDMSTLDCSIL